MFTVILLSDRSKRILDRWRELFVPFEEQGLIAFCTWNQGPSPQVLEQAVPDLASAIKGKKEWRALVVGTGAEHAYISDYLARENPFDFAYAMSDSPSDSLPSPSPFPLIRLTHMLLGYPELGPKAFEPDPSFQDPDTERRVFQSEFTGDSLDKASLDAALNEFKSQAVRGHHPRIHYRVIPPSPEELEAHGDLTKLYEARQTRPTEIVIVAVRQPRTEPQRDDLLSAWSSSSDRHSTRFVERNNYPASCRFVVCDMKPKGHVGLDLEEMSFALGLLTLAVNELPASGLQSDRLYRMDVELDRESMGDVLNAHLGGLVEMRDYIDARLKAHQSRPRSPGTHVLAEATVTVDFDRIRGEELRVSLAGYSVANDRPSVESERWRASLNDLKLHAGRFMREPSRALEQAVVEAHAKASARANGAEPLGDLDIVDLEEELARRSDGLVRRATDQIIDAQELSKLIDRHDRQVSRAIEERMSSSSISMVMGVVVGVWCVALLPYLIAATFNGAVNLAESLLVTGVVLGTVVGVGLLTLEVMRRQLLALMRQFNRELRSFVSSVTKGAQDYAAFLSDLVTYSGGRQRLLAEQRRNEQLRSEQVKLRRLQRRIEERIDLEKSLVKSVGRPVHIEKGSQVVSEVEKLGLTHAEEVLLWQPKRTPCEFNRSGDEVSAPYPFIRRLSVRDLVMYEPAMHGPVSTEASDDMMPGAASSGALKSEGSPSD